MDDLRKLREEINLLKRRADQKNIRRQDFRAPIYTLSIIGGNSLSSGQNGIKNIVTPSSCPADYDPQTDTSYADGWGNAYLMIDGVTQSRKVLVLNDGSLGTIVESWLLITSGPNTIIQSGTIYKTFYRPASYA